VLSSFFTWLLSPFQPIPSVSLSYTFQRIWGDLRVSPRSLEKKIDYRKKEGKMQGTGKNNGKFWFAKVARVAFSAAVLSLESEKFWQWWN